jgi:hypothetical protein
MIAPQSGPSPHPHSSCSPVFIVGSPRSGTTLLQSMISSSGEIAIAPEHDFLLRFRERYVRRDFRERATRAAFVSDLFALRATHYWKVDRALLIDALDALRPVNYSGVVRGIYESFAASHGTRRWGAKIPFFALHLPLLRDMFPDVCVIHLVRDGRDVLASMRERARNGARHFPTDARLAALRWRQLVLGGSEGQRLLSVDRYLELRYEDLIANTQSTLQAIEQFLNCRLSGASERHYRHALGTAVVHSDQIDRYLHPGVNARGVARWRGDLTRRDVHWFEAIAGGVLRIKGYPTGSLGRQSGLAIAGCFVTAAYSMYRRLPRSLKLTVRQHVS